MMLHIGAKVETVKAARAAIMEILAAACGDGAKKKALEAFVRVCEVRNPKVKDCQFYGGKQPKKEKEKQS